MRQTGRHNRKIKNKGKKIDNYFIKNYNSNCEKKKRVTELR